VLGRVIPCLKKSGGAPCGTYYGEDLNFLKACAARFGGQFLRTMEVRGSEVFGLARRVAMLARREINCHDGAKLRVREESSRSPSMSEAK